MLMQLGHRQFNPHQAVSLIVDSSWTIPGAKFCKWQRKEIQGMLKIFSNSSASKQQHHYHEQ